MVRKSNVREYTRRDGTRVRRHSRNVDDSDERMDIESMNLEKSVSKKKYSFKDLLMQSSQRIRLDNYDREIIRFLAKKGSSTMNETAEMTNMSWATAKSHLEKLEKQGYVFKNEVDKNRTYWQLIETD